MRALPSATVLSGILLGLLLALPTAPAVAGEGQKTATSPGDSTPLPPTPEERVERALVLLRAEGGPAAVAAEAARGPAALRRAAFEALATLSPEAFPDGGVHAAVSALESPDGLLRRAAVRALLAAGPRAEALLEAILAEVDPPATERIRDALFDIRRARVEREFLLSWRPSDGSYRGMYTGLGPRGGPAARVLTAVALDRRMAGGRMLAYGPYDWFHPPGPDRERQEVRFRALDALVDVGDPAARETLRGALRAEPAENLYDDFDEDPVPAALDDALRDTMASLGDPGPLWRMLAASDGGMRRGFWMESLEMRRRARGFCTLAENASQERVATAYYTNAEDLHRRSLSVKKAVGQAVDGVDWYNLACVLARRDRPGDRREALRLLRDSVKTYSITADWLARDGDLASLRGEKEFAEVLQVLKDREEALEMPEGR